MSVEFDDLVRRAKQFGIDLNVVMDEIDHRVDARETQIAKKIFDQIPRKPDIEEIAKEVAGKIQAGAVDIDSVVNQVLEKIPDTGEVERQKVRKEVSQELVQVLGNIEKRVEGMVKPLVDSALMEQKDWMLAAVRAEMNQRQEEIMNKIAGGEGNGNGNALKTRWGNIPWDKVLEFADKMTDKNQDPFAGIDRVLELRQKLASLEPQGPDPSSLFRSQTASFLEGIKLGAKAKPGIEPKKLSGPPGGPSTQVIKSSNSDPIIDTL